MTLVVNSASPRRRALIALLETPFRLEAAPVDEQAYLREEPTCSAIGIALAKARAAHLDSGDIALGADTLVVLDESVLGKPNSAEEARAMLTQLRGRSHTVMTGVVLSRADGTSRAERIVVESTTVQMRHFSDDEVEDYIARGEPFDKAGGYAVQDARFNPVAEMQGCWLNVVGLPLCAIAPSLESLGATTVKIPPEPQAPCSLCHRGFAATRID